MKNRPTPSNYSLISFLLNPFRRRSIPITLKKNFHIINIIVNITIIWSIYTSIYVCKYNKYTHFSNLVAKSSFVNVGEIFGHFCPCFMTWSCISVAYEPLLALQSWLGNGIRLRNLFCLFEICVQIIFHYVCLYYHNDDAYTLYMINLDVILFSFVVYLMNWIT